MKCIILLFLSLFVTLIPIISFSQEDYPTYPKITQQIPLVEKQAQQEEEEDDSESEEEEKEEEEEEDDSESDSNNSSNSSNNSSSNVTVQTEQQEKETEQEQTETTMDGEQTPTDEKPETEEPVVSHKIEQSK